MNQVRTVSNINIITQERHYCQHYRGNMCPTHLISQGTISHEWLFDRSVEVLSWQFHGLLLWFSDYMKVNHTNTLKSVTKIKILLCAAVGTNNHQHVPCVSYSLNCAEKWQHPTIPTCTKSADKNYLRIFFIHLWISYSDMLNDDLDRTWGSCYSMTWGVISVFTHIDWEMAWRTVQVSWFPAWYSSWAKCVEGTDFLQHFENSSTNSTAS